MALSERPRTLRKDDAVRNERSMETLRDLFAQVVRTIPADKVLLRIKAGTGWRMYTTSQFAQAVYETAGQFDVAVIIKGPNIGELNKSVEGIRRVVGVISTNTMMILRTFR